MSDPYRDLAEPFVSHYGRLRGALRQTLVSEQLGEHLTEACLRIVDVGGGAGHQAIALARTGHVAVVVEPSREMLRRAREAIEAEPSEVQRRLRLVEASGIDAPAAVGHERFDVVLCHGVLPYVEVGAEPDLMGALADLARPGAVVSVLFKNAAALAMRPALEGRWDDAAEAFDAGEDVGGIGVVTRAQRLGDVERWARAVGLDLAAWYGIRVMSDHLTDASTDELAAVLPVERQAARRDPYRALGRLIHAVFARSGEATAGAATGA